MTHRDLISADQAISDSTLPAFIRGEMSKVLGEVFDGESAGIDAWAHPASLIQRHGSRRVIDAFWDLVGEIDLIAIRAEGEALRASERSIA